MQAIYSVRIIGDYLFNVPVNYMQVPPSPPFLHLLTKNNHLSDEEKLYETVEIRNFFIFDFELQQTITKVVDFEKCSILFSKFIKFKSEIQML